LFPLNKLRGIVHTSQLVGTHNVQTVDVNNYSRPRVVNISCTFAETSTAMGYLLILWPRANSSQEMFVVANRLNASRDDLDISVPGVLPGEYMVVVFDLQSNGLPVLSTVTSQHTLSAGERDITVLEQEANVIEQGYDGGMV